MVGEQAAPGPAFVLVAPQMGENIGAAARAMWNFGLDRMRLVSPRDGWPNPRAEAMASGAGRVLDRAELHAGTAAACADLGFVFATTARERAMTKRVLTPERAGLATEDVVRANAVISVPANPEYASLNLAQCVLLVAYEWQRAASAAAADDYRIAGGRLATGGEVDRLLAHLTGRLDAVGFFFPEARRASMAANRENLFRRAPLTDADVRTLHGVVRALALKQPGRKPRD